MKNRSRNLDGQTQAKHTGILKDRKIRDLFFKRIRFNLLKGWISPQPAGFLFHHQSTKETLNFFYIFFSFLNQIVNLFFIWMVMRGPDLRKVEEEVFIRK